MLYPDPEGSVDRLLDESTAGKPILDVLDDYGARHRVWAITDTSRIARIQELMAPKKLLIADGHHRYETALAYRHEHPDDPAAQYVMMTFVNMHSPGLKILATHRVLRNIEGFDVVAFFDKAVAAGWSITACGTAAALKDRMGKVDPELVQIGVATKGDARLMQRPRHKGQLDVPVLHHDILAGL